MSKDVRWNHGLDMCFSIETPHEDWTDCTDEELLEALQRRVDSLREEKARGGSIKEAFGDMDDSYEVERKKFQVRVEEICTNSSWVEVAAFNEREAMAKAKALAEGNELTFEFQEADYLIDEVKEVD